MTWVQEQLEDDKVFPDKIGVAFPKVTTIFTIHIITTVSVLIMGRSIFLLILQPHKRNYNCVQNQVYNLQTIKFRKITKLNGSVNSATISSSLVQVEWCCNRRGVARWPQPVLQLPGGVLQVSQVQGHSASFQKFLGLRSRTLKQVTKRFLIALWTVLRFSSLNSVAASQEVTGCWSYPTCYIQQGIPEAPFKLFFQYHFVISCLAL